MWQAGACTKVLAVTASAWSAQASLRGEWVNMGLLVVLYAMQGVPLGLTLGSMCVATPGRACMHPHAASQLP